ncbi:MAG: toxin-antitoxin system YwqK family antitoxin [Bacteroidia bacterium]
MKLLFLCILASLNLTAFAQLKPIYFRGNDLISDSTKATSYGVYGKLSGENLYALKIFDLYDNLTTTGTYKDEELKVPHGNFVYYGDVNLYNSVNGTSFMLKGKNRYVTGKGSFIDGKQSGRWMTFFPDGKVMNVTTYVNGVKHGFYGLYDRKGKTIVSGSYYVGEKDGVWLYKDGKTKETYVKGVKQVETKNKRN